MRVHTDAPADPPFSLTGDLQCAHSFETALLSRREPASYEIDVLGHVNNVVYLAWAQEMGQEHWRLAAENNQLKDYLWVGLRHDVSYKSEIRAGEHVELRTWLAEPKGASMDRHVDIRKAGETTFAARVVSTWCLIDAASRKPRRVAQSVGAAFGWGPNA